MKNIIKASATFIAAMASAALLATPASAAHPGTGCIKQVVAAAAKAGVATEPDELSLLVMAPTAPPLQPLLAQMIACLDRALPEQTDRVIQEGEKPQHYWFITATKQYCRGHKDIGTLGGNSERKSWLSFFLVCNGTK
ncbi:MAG TPA: hypothetical protein VMI56_25820 [Reyranella sp.]|nr:hypothetical protein [Reyranella sp.]